MPVILMDPALPDLIPAHGVSYLSGHVFVTEEVHPKLLWDLPSYEYVSVPRELPPGSVVLTSDREHPLVRQQIAHGDELIGGQTVTGTRLLEAVALMDRLRRTGPWEKQQTHDSLRRYLLEEVYELLDAFDGDDSSELCSELGDLLLQVLFHARIAEDSAVGAFDIDDVAQSFISKVSYRTPGVLAGEHADIERQINEWEERKAAERSRGSVLDGLVTAQPALSLTQKLFERLGAAGFPRDAISPNLTRVDIPVRKHARESVEDNLRRSVLTLMRQVRAAENAAGVDGVVPRDENTWRKYLGMSYDDAEPDEAEPLADRADPLADRAEPLADRAESRSPADEEHTPSLVEPGDEGARVETPTLVASVPDEETVASLVEPVRSEATSRVETPTDIVEAEIVAVDEGEGEVVVEAKPGTETTDSIPPVQTTKPYDDVPLNDPSSFYFAFPKPGSHEAPPPRPDVPRGGFPEAEDFPAGADRAEPFADRADPLADRADPFADRADPFADRADPFADRAESRSDVPAPPPIPKRTVKKDPIKAKDRTLDLPYGDPVVPRLVVKSDWDE
ncbi:MazG nucleotide pyrophosphohydrolase domain-containing protein [Gordonia iterans]